MSHRTELSSVQQVSYQSMKLIYVIRAFYYLCFFLVGNGRQLSKSLEINLTLRLTLNNYIFKAEFRKKGKYSAALLYVGPGQVDLGIYFVVSTHFRAALKLYNMF